MIHNQSMPLLPTKASASAGSGFFRALWSAAGFRTLVVACLLSIIFAPYASAAITVDATSQQFGAIGTTSLTFPHTLGSGSGRLVVCGVQIANPTTAIANITPTVTIGGIPMIAITGSQAPTHTEASTSKIEGEMFYVNDTGLGSTSGVVTVDVELPSTPTGGVAASCTSFFGMAQTAPEASSAAYNGSNVIAYTTTSLTTITAGDLVIDSFSGGFTASGSPTKTAAPYAGQTQLSNAQLSTAGVFSGSSYEIAGAAGSVTVGWTDTVSRSAYSAVAFAPTAATYYPVTTSVSPAGSGTITLSPSAASYAGGTSVQVTATPGTYYSFTGFTGDLTSTTNPSTITVNAGMNIVANFAQNQCTLTIATAGSGTGTVTPSSNSYACGSTIYLNATPSTGSSFGQWTASGAGAGTGYSGTTSSSNFILSANTTETATFVQGTTCTLGTSVTGSGSITLSPSGGSYSCGTGVTVTAVPATSDWSFTGFTGALTGTTNPQTLTLMTNSTVAAAFTQVNFPVNVTVVGPGTVVANPNAASYATGTQVQLTATPSAGAYFVGFTGDLTSTSNPATVTVNTTKNITATFAYSLITQDSVSHAVSTGATSVLSWQHKLGAGSSRAVVIAVGTSDTLASPDANAVVSTVLFNGVYATPIPNSVQYGGSSSNVQTQLFYLTDAELPVAGTYTVQVNLVGSVSAIQAGAISLFGVNQGPPEAVATNHVSGIDQISTPITTLTNNAWIIDVVEDYTVSTLTANSGQTLAWSQSSTGLGTGGSSTESVATAGAVTPGWNAVAANRMAESLVDFAPIGTSVPATFALTTNVVGGGSITTNPGISQYPPQTGVLLTATPTVGYTFTGWSGDFTSTANPLPIVMDNNHTITANFTAASTCTVNYTIVGQGTVSPSSGSVYNCGTSLALTATPSSGYSFTSWSGDFSSTDNPATFTLNANSNITVEFDAIPQCTLTMMTVGTGTLTPSTGSYACGSSVTIAATQTNSAWPFSGFSGDYVGTVSPATITLNGNMSVTGTFVQGSTCTLTTSVTGLGTISPSSGSYLCGTQIPISAIPSAHYLFGSWGGALSGSTTPTTLTLSSNLTVSAAFSYDTSGVTGDGRGSVPEPTYPAVCTVLRALQSVTSPVETSPDTTRVQSALNACTSGQAVEFSASTDLTKNAFIIAPITVPAGVTMLVDPEVTILGSIKSTDYSCNTSQSWCTPLIGVAPNSNAATGSGIMGLGVIDGRGGVTLTDLGKSWWATGSDVRPRLVYLSSRTTGASSDYFTAYKITLKNSPKFHLSGLSNNLTVWGIKIYAPPDAPNTDGIDPSGSSNITITQSYISDGDDWISPKAGVGHVSNVTISNNHTYSGHGISIGSETNAGLNNMYVHDIAIDNGFGGSSYDSLRIKSDSSRGGEVYDVHYNNICINNGGDTIVIDPAYSSATGVLYPNFHDITFSNVHKLIHSSSYKSTIIGYTSGSISNPVTVTLDNVAFDGDSTNDYKSPSNFYNVQFSFGPGPVSMASYLTNDAAISTNLVTVTNNISNSSEAAYDCTGAFVYLAGDLTAPTASTTGTTASVAAGSAFTLTAVLQNVVSPIVAGTLTYSQNNMPTGTINVLEGTNVVGTATITSGSRLTYITIPANLITAGSHTYTAQYVGDTHYSALSFGSFTLTAVANTVPVAAAQTVSVTYNTATSITLAATNSPISYAVASSPTHGTLGTVSSTGVVTYTPTINYYGTDSFTFTATNAGGTSSPATISITVLPAAPVTSNQTLTVVYNTATPFTLSATGSGTITYSVITNPTHGVLSGTTPNLTYTPTTNYIGTDSFTFKANNGTDSNTSTYNVTVNPAVPVAATQSVTVTYKTATTITLAATNNPTSYAIASSPLHGTLGTVSSTGVVTYTPASTYSGTDSFTFTATNTGGTSSPATVSITVLATAPVAAAQSVTVTYNTATAITLTASNSPTSYAIATSPLHGTLSTVSSTGVVTYTPTSSYSGTDSFTFTATNAGGTSSPATVSITVSPAAPVAAAQSVSVFYNTATSISLSATGSGTLTYSVVASPAHGTLGTVSSTGAVTYTPTIGYSGADSFTFKANNGTDSNIATVTITVLAAAPVATGQTLTIQALTVGYNTATPITLIASGSGTLTYIIVNSPTHGTLSGTAPNLTYTPTTGYYGTDSFTFKANNGTDSNIATVTITVLPAAPVASGQSLTVAYNTATSITLSATGNGTLTYTVVASPTHGTLSGIAPALTYTPTTGYSGSDSFTFTATNAGGTSLAATVSITIAGEALVLSPAPGGSLTATVSAGQPATYNLQIAGWIGANSTVNFACSGAPASATCTVSPTSTILNGATEIPFTVTVATQASASMHTLPASGSHPGNDVPISLAAGLAVCLLGLRKRSRRLRRWSALAIGLMVLTVSLVTGCGSKNYTPSDTPGGSYALTVTATSGGVSQAVSLTLIVK